MFSVQLFVYLFLVAGVVLSIKMRKLTFWGGITGGMVGLLVYLGGGNSSLIMLLLFFIAGSAATRFGVKHKQLIGAAEQRSGQRTAAQVLANGGVAALCALATLLWPAQLPLFRLMLAGSLASAMADTVSSELGMIFGKRFFNILTLKPEKAGLDGVVSLEGTLIGLAGACLVSATYAVANGLYVACLWIAIAGFTGNLADSLLGATLERKKLMGNNLVNFSNTAVGALVCWLLYYL